MKASIVEVGPRDGLQNEKVSLSIEDRLELIRRLMDSGLKRIEVGAFVSPKKVPQMASSSELLMNLNRQVLAKDFRLSVLVPNLQGMEEALNCGATEIALFTAASESFTLMNINCSIEESFQRFEPVAKMAKSKKIKIRAYLSTCFGCPYEGKVNPKKVIELCVRLAELGAYEISVGDTIGVANPKQVRSLIRNLAKEVPLKKLAMHFHDTRGTALANIYASLEEGIRTFDSSVGGLGGCPYAPGASGNVATEDVIFMLKGMGIDTGIDISKLIEINAWVAGKLGRKLPSKLGQAGLPKA